MTIAVYGRNTLAGAKRIVFDEGINIAPHAKSSRERIIEMAARWNEKHVVDPVRRKPVSQPKKVRRTAPSQDVVRRLQERAHAAAVKELRGRSMPQWALLIAIQTAEARGTSLSVILSRSRSRNVVPVRNEVFYLLRTTPSPVTGSHPSYPQIASWFGRDHTGIMWGASKHAMDNGLPRVGRFDINGASAKKRDRHRIERGEK